MGRRSNLGDLEELALLCVRRLGQGADGGSVREQLADLAGRKVSVYVTLMRLEEKGYARSRLGDPTAERGGRAKRLFAVTPEGVEALEARRAVRDRLWSPSPDAEAEGSGV